MSNFSRLYVSKALFALTICLLPLTLFAQDDSEMEFFEGGFIRSEFSSRSNLLTGTGVRGAYGGLIAPIKPEPFVIFGNPAAIRRIKGKKMIISSAPGFEFDLASLGDPNPTIEESMDETLKSFNLTGRKTYPKMTGKVGLLGSAISGFALVLPVDPENNDRWFDGRIPRLFDQIAFGYTVPYVLQSKFVYSGLRMRIRTIDKDENNIRHPENEILLYASIKMDSHLDITSDSWNMSVARAMGKLTLGAGVQRTGARIELHVNQRTDGIMSKAGSESSFNDPQSPWDDDFYFSAHGIFEGSALALRLGALYEPSDKFIIGAMCRLQGDMDMDADFDLQLHSFTPLKLNATEGEKQFDVNAIQDASELTRTTAKSYETASDMKFSVPGEISVAATYTGFLKPSITFTKYFGELAYQYKIIENGAPFTYKRGYKPSIGINLYFDAYILKYGVGAVKVVDVVAGYHDAHGTPIPPAKALWVPHLSFGFEMGLTDALKLGVLLEGLPEDVLRLTLEYSL